MSVLFFAILFASCSSDDDNNSSEKTIVGAWTLTEANLAIPQDFNGDGTADRNFKNEVPCFVGTVSFTGEGTYSQTFSEVDPTTFECTGTIATTGTYSLDGDQLTTTNDDPDPETTTTTIDLNGNTLKADFEFGTFGNVELVYKRN